VLLKRGDSGEDVRSLQRGLNKLGSLLLIDGHFGPGTGDAVMDGRVALRQPGPPEADDAFQQALAALPDPFPALTAPGMTFIGRAEVSGPREYQMKYKNPVWPGARSGITIGIGYDLRFADRARLDADWGGQLTSDAVKRLAAVLGAVGSAELLSRVRDIEVPLLAAVSVFLRRSLPGTLQKTLSIYPQARDLTPARRTALVSLVYNRGSRLRDSNPALEDRREMRTIRDLLAAARFDEVADQLDAMCRLWGPAMPGLVQRRRDEARLWRSGFAPFQLD